MKKNSNLKVIKNDKSKAKYIIENKDKLILKRKRKKQIRRNIIIIIFLIAVLCTMAIKLPYFNIKSFTVEGNKNAVIKEIEQCYSTELNKNIFLFNFQDLKERLKKNKYIENVSIKRKLPNEVAIKIHEREASFYFSIDKLYYIVDSKGNILETTEDIKGRKLLELKGFSAKDIKNNSLEIDERQKKLLEELLSLINSNTSAVKITAIDIYDCTSIKVYSNNIKVVIGTEYSLKDKLNKGINIITLHKIEGKKGYVDVSYNGNPVVFTE